MGIYISAVKGLPEQVQENKEDIKTIKEEIEGIDFEEIRQLEAQVGENTQDINNLEASIGVQNQAINGLNDRADALESKTQLMSYNSDLSMTDFRNSIEVADDVYARNVRVEGDGSIVNTTQSGFHFKEGANDDTLTIANNDGTTPHYLHFNADGTLDIDGNPVGASKHIHNVMLYITNVLNCNLIIQSDSDTPFTFATLRQWLYENGFTSSYQRKAYPIQGAYYDGTADRITYMIIAPNLTGDLTIYYPINGSAQATTFGSSGFVKDVVL